MNMENENYLKKAEKAIKKVAALNKVSVDEVRRDIEEAIKCGIDSPDKRIQDTWKKIPCEGDIPTPEEVVVWAMGELNHKENCSI